MKFPLFELYFGWFIFVLYLVNFLYYAFCYLKRKEQRRFFWWFIIFTFTVHGILILERWIRVGHGPYLTNYEVFFSNAWMVMASFILIRFLIRRDLELLTLGAFVGTLVFLLFGLERYTPEVGVPSKYFYIWLIIHVFFSKLSLGLVFLTLGYAVYLVIGKEEKEEILYRLLILILVSWTFSIVSGALWAQERWGRYWGWDPIETWSLILWILLALLIHGIRFFRIKGRILGILVLVTIVLFVVVTAFLPFIVKTIHTMYLLGGE